MFSLLRLSFSIISRRKKFLTNARSFVRLAQTVSNHNWFIVHEATDTYVSKQ